MLQGHIVLRLKTDAGAEDVGESGALLGKSVDNRGTRRSERSLEHVAEDTEHAVEVVELAIAAFGSVGLPLDTGHHLSDQNQIDNQRRSQERVLANVEQADGLVAVEEDLRVVLVKSALVVSNSRHVLDDDAVVGVFAFLVQNVIGSDHVIDDVGLGDLLGAELLLRAEVHAVVVAQVVVGSNRGELDTGADHEVDEGRLHLGLTRLEVVTANEGVVLLGELDSTRDECVLRGTVDEGNTLKNGSHSKDSGRGNLFVTRFDRFEQVVRRVVDALDDVGIALSVSSPLHNDLVETVGRLEITTISSVKVGLMCMGSRLTGCPCGSAQHGHWKPWYLREHCRHVPPGWQQ